MQSHPNACVSLQGRHRLVSQHLEFGRGPPQPPAAPEAHRPAASGSLLHRRQDGALWPPADFFHIHTFCRGWACAMGVLNSEAPNGWLPRHLAI
jgi:hypothetical protein